MDTIKNKIGTKKDNRTTYVCTSISFSPEEVKTIQPLTIPANDELLKMMAVKLKKEKIEKQPKLKDNIGIKFSVACSKLYKEVRDKLKSLNISMSSFYKKCYYEYVEMKTKEAEEKKAEKKETEQKRESDKLIENVKTIKDVAQNH